MSGLDVSGAHTTGQLLAMMARGSDVELPDIPPPRASTHLHRYYPTS